MKPLDRLGKGLLLACAVLFLVGVGLRLNGSSSLIWKDELKDTSNPAHVLIGSPQEVRSDEWLVWTPALVAQTKLGFPAENPALGAGKAPFLYSLPVRHYTMVFRPQLYGFFLFNLEYGYAWYWNTKVFGLIAAMFLLFWTLTGRSGLSLFGSLFVFFSSYVQWWFSCPPMLPEMLSAWAVAVVCAIILLRAERNATRAMAATAFAASTTSFVLCLYPPFQIPLAYLGVAVVWAFNFSATPLGRAIVRRNVFSLVVAFLVTGAVLTPFLCECAPTLRILSATAYPGRRQSYGGELSWMKLFSGLLNFFNTSTRYPDGFDQVNDAANFFPLWLPLLFFTAPALIANPRKHAIAWASVATLMLFTVYALVPLPHWFCRVTLLSACTGTRALLGIGIANIVFCVVTLPILKQRFAEASRRKLWMIAAVCVALALVYLSAAVGRNPRFLQPPQLVLFLAVNVAVLAALLLFRARVFAAAFVFLLAASNACVNPLSTGLDGLTKSEAAKRLGNIVRQDPHARWVAYDTTDLSQLLLSVGADVISGAKTVPNLELYRLLDPTGKNAAVYNRYSISQFAFRRDRASIGFRYLAFPITIVSVHPLHEALRAYHVRYFVFPKPLRDPAREGIELVCALPENELWAYRIAGGSPAANASSESATPALAVR